MSLLVSTHRMISEEILPRKWSKPNKLVAICGKRYCGKTTAALILAEAGYSLKSMSDPAKRTYAEMVGVPLADMYNQNKEKHRQGLISYCDSERQRDPDIFIKLYVQKLYLEDRIVCDDLRFPNELEGLLLMGAIPLRIKAEPEVRLINGWIPDEKIDTHLTEIGLDHLPDKWFFDNGGAVIDNPGVGFRDLFASQVVDFENSLVQM